MSNGYVMLAQNSQDNYVLQACLCAMSLKVTQQFSNVSLITNDDVPQEYQHLFDKIIPIPGTDDAADSNWKIENRWKIYNASPYNKTIVLDTDMIVLSDLTSYWNFLEKYKIFFTGNVYNYRGTIADNSFYRQTFLDNNLPNLYSGLHYFEKSNSASEFYLWLEVVLTNWQLFYKSFLDIKSRPVGPSIDVCAAIVAVILDINITNYKPLFTHMKLKSQGWLKPSSSWQIHAGCYVSTDGTIKIGNYLQTGILHYTEKDLLTNTNIVSIYKDILNV